MNLTQKVFVALVAGILLGLIINISGLYSPGSFTQVYIVDGFFHVIGKLFVNALKMLVVPLVFFSLVCGVLGIGDIRLLGRVGGKSFGLYLLTTALAVALALTVAATFAIGAGLEATPTEPFSGKAPSILDSIIGIVPSNPIKAMADSNMLAVIFFSLVFGICALACGDKVQSVNQLLDQLNTIMMKMVELIMHFAPYAVFCLLAKAVSQLGFDLLKSLIGYVLVLAGVLIFHGMVVIPLLLKVFSGLNPITFINKVRATQLFAFSTASSSATIPVTLRTTEKRLGADGSVASFTVPFGATINMDGTAMMQGVATVFIANIYGIDLGLVEYLTVIFMAVLASVGTAGVPSVGLVMLTMVFAQVNLPVEGIALILGVDRIMDMIRTTVNVTGDAMVTCVVAKSENKLDTSIFADPHTGVLEEPEHEVAVQKT